MVTKQHGWFHSILRLFAVLSVFALLAAGCGSSDSDGGDTGSDSTSTDTDDGATDDGGTDDGATDDGGTDDGATDDGTDDGATDDGGTDEASTAGTCDPTQVLRWGYGDSIRDWDPHNSPAGQDLTYLMMVYDRLFHMTPDAVAIPGLAESWAFNDDATVLTINVRPGVKFHNGTDLTADIVKQNLDRSSGKLNPADGEEGFTSSFGADLASVDEVVVIDDLTVEVRLSRPDVSIVGVLADRPGMMLEPSTFVTEAAVPINEPIGAGPFMLDSWTEGDGGQAVMSKFADYWDADNIQIAGIVLSDLTESSARFNALRSGELDGTQLDPADHDAAASDDSLTVITGDILEVFWYLLDQEIVPELGDVRVRQAMSLAIDRQGIVDGLAFGLGTPSVTLIPPHNWAASPNLVIPERDLDAARALMAEAGTDGFTVPILGFADNGLRTQVTAAVQANLAEIGIIVEIEVAGDNLASRLFFDRDGGGVVGPWSGRIDPAQTIANTSGPGFVNMAKDSSPEIDALLLEANAATDQDERAALFGQIDELNAELFISGIPIFSPKQILAFTTNVSGIEVYGTSRPEFRNTCIASE